MNRKKRSIFYPMWSVAIFVVLLLALAAILVASFTKARDVVPVTTGPELSGPILPSEAPADGPPAAVDPAATEPADASAALIETADVGQEYVDKFVFLGDSTTYSLAYHDIVNDSQVWTPLSGTLTLELWDASTVSYPATNEELFIVDAVASAKPEFMMITLGVNSINGLANAKEDYFIECYTALVQAIQTASPETRIILNSIYPVCNSYPYQSSINNTAIDTANGWVYRVAEATGARYLDSASVLKGADGALPEDYDMDDGIHLNADALKLVINYLRTHAYQ